MSSDIGTLHFGDMKSSIHNFDTTPNPEAECKRKCLKWTGIIVVIILLINAGIGITAYILKKG